MSDLKAIYLIVSGASAARCVPNLIEALTQFELPIYTFLTRDAHNIISPYNLADQEGHTLVQGYFDPVLVNSREPGLTLVAPATFNTLNKISQGIADTLPHSLAAEAIGAGWPVIVVPAMNLYLYNHPKTAQSVAALRSWGIMVLEPVMERDLLVMAPEQDIIAAVRTALQSR